MRASLNNAEFLAGLRNQNPAAAKHLCEYFVPSIWRFVYVRVNGDRHLAEDIVSEAVLALVTAVAGGTDIEYPTAWMRSVALRRVQDHFRAAARVQHLMTQVSSTLNKDVHDTPATEHDKKLRHEEVRAAMDRLPEPYRLALEWKYLDRLSVREIATRLNASEKGAESLLFRARNHFRSELAKSEQTEAPPIPNNCTSDNDHDIDNRQPSFPNEMTRTRS
jgi:RNA polymerase sigma factor (sigma-70 family)